MIVKPYFINTQLNKKCHFEMQNDEWSFVVDTLHMYCRELCEKSYEIWWDDDVDETGLIHIDVDDNLKNRNITNRAFQKILEDYSDYGKKNVNLYLTFEIVYEQVHEGCQE